jgi:hypothetical protein
MKRLVLILLLAAALAPRAAHAQAVQYPSLPNCADTAGQHLNYNAATLLFSCGTTGSVSNLTGAAMYPLGDNGGTFGAGTYTAVGYFPWTSGTITAVSYATAGSSSPAFTLQLLVNGVAVLNCTAITVNSATPAATTCTSTAISKGQRITFAVSSLVGVPETAFVEPIFTHSAN